MITPANAMKMNLIQPQEGVFDWTDTDALSTWAAKNNLEFRGHPLVWHTQAPSWLKDAKFVKDDMTMFTAEEIREKTITVMYAHIDALMTKYLGKFPNWDVVNEALDDMPGNGAFGYRSTFWLDRIGPDFIELAFKRAHMADPNAKLFYNDYNIEQMGNQKGDRAFELVKDLKMRGVPIDGVGLQGHYYYYSNPTTGVLEGIPDMAAIRANIARYNEIGVEVHITESDFRIQKPITDDKVQVQTKFYADFLQICIDAPNCSHFTVWGLSDIDSWVPSTFPEFDSAHLYDTSFNAKPGYYAMTDVFAKYNADGSMAGGGAGPKESGCSLVPGTGESENGQPAAVLGLLGLAMLLRRGSKRSAS
jgi:endo-1,4-beta-xylanase